MKKVFFVICDGLPDRPIKELDNKTPLEYANTPNLDKIAIDGISGMMHTVDIGVRPGSDTAHLSIFGYDPYIYYTGRGPYECLGIGMDVDKGDVAFRANLGTIDENGIIIDRRAGRIDSESTRKVVDFFGSVEIDGIKFIMKGSLGHRVGLVIKGKGLSSNISDQDSHKAGLAPHAVKALDDTTEAKFTADIMNKFNDLIIEKLKDFPLNQERIAEGKLPSNIVLFRGAGAISDKLLSFKEKYNLNASFIAGAPMYKGIAKSLGMNVVEFSEDSGVTGLPTSNLENKISRAMEELNKDDVDIVFVHIKAADSLAEDGNYKGEVEFIEKMDKALKPIAENNDWIVVVTSDHTTSADLKMHTADPVPVTIKGPGVRTDDISGFNERECAKGRMGQIRGQNLMPIVIDLMGMAELYGA